MKNTTQIYVYTDTAKGKSSIAYLIHKTLAEHGISSMITENPDDGDMGAVIETLDKRLKSISHYPVQITTRQLNHGSHR